MKQINKLIFSDYNNDNCDIVLNGTLSFGQLFFNESDNIAQHNIRIAKTRFHYLKNKITTYRKIDGKSI